jgi:hypothetical protein
MSKTPTYKAVAFEHSHGRDYNMGKGVAFSDSIKNAIKAAKHRAFGDLAREENEADDPGTPILATIEVFKGDKKIYFESY